MPSSKQDAFEQFNPIAAVLSDFYDRIDELAKRQEEIVGVPTGFLDLDKLLLGHQSQVKGLKDLSRGSV